MTSKEQQFTADVTDLPLAGPTEVVELSDGDRFELRIAPVAKRVGDDTVRMLAYNGSIPGPVLRVRQGAQVAVEIENQGDMENTVHWHGLRLDNRYDGTAQTQAPIQVGGRFTAVIKCPDPGAYWYHPHIRSDYGIEMGLYGGIVVEPADHDYWPPVHRELFLTLDDLLLEEGQVAPFSREETTHAAMGRFGNVLLVNGETDLALTAHRGEVLRLYLLNTANTRVFNVGLPGARIKLVGGDSGHVEQEEWVEEVVIAPSERFVVDVTFDAAGEFALQHRTPDRVYPLAAVTVQEEPAEPSLAETFAQLRSSPDMVDERARIRPYLEAPPDETLCFLAEMNLPEPKGDGPVGT
jgi:FtsP/CotA-like multicopper oxidase with cupredoxin domain